MRTDRAQSDWTAHIAVWTCRICCTAKLHLQWFRGSLVSGQSGAGAGFYPNTSVFPVSIIPPFLHTHPSIYHPHCILFLSQYFSFPCQYHSTIAPYSSIHLPPTLYNVFLPVFRFPLSVTFDCCSILIHRTLMLCDVSN